MEAIKAQKPHCQEDKAGFLLAQPPPLPLALVLFWIVDPRWADEAKPAFTVANCFSPTHCTVEHPVEHPELTPLSRS